MTGKQRYFFVKDVTEQLSQAITVAEKDAVVRVSLAKEQCMLDAFTG